VSQGEVVEVLRKDFPGEEGFAFIRAANKQAVSPKLTTSAAKHFSSSNRNILNVQPVSNTSQNGCNFAEQSVTLGVADSFISMSPSSQVENFSQQMWVKTGLIAVVEFPLHQQT
jgi:hypothetical protein